MNDHKVGRADCKPNTYSSALKETVSISWREIRGSPIPRWSRSLIDNVVPF